MIVKKEAFIVAAAFFLEVLDATIMIPALPTIALSLQAEISTVTVAIAAYVCALAVCTPLGPHLLKKMNVADKMMLGLLISLAASLLCAASVNVPMLLASRLLQGAGSALVVPPGRALVLGQGSKEEIPLLMSYLIWPALLAPILAPAVGGYLAQYYGWQAIFLFVAVLTVMVMALVYVGIPKLALAGSPAADMSTHLMWSGAAVATFLFFVFSSYQRAAFAALSLCLAICLFYFYHRRASRLDAAIFSSRLFMLNLVSGSFFRIAIYCFPILLSLALIMQFHFSPASAGVCILFIFLGNVLAKPVAAWLLAREINLRLYFGWALLATLASIAAFFFIPRSPGPGHVYLLCSLHGAARSFLFLGYSSVSFYEIERPHLYQANVYAGSMMQINALIGQAIPAMLLMAMERWHPAERAKEDLLTFSVGIVSVLLIASAVSLKNQSFGSRQSTV